MLKGDIWRLNEVLVEFDVVKLHQIVHQNEFGCIELYVCTCFAWLLCMQLKLIPNQYLWFANQ